MSLSTAVAAILLLSCAGAEAATCIDVNQIQNSDSTDGKTLILKMKDGKVWRAELIPGCPDIRMNGFVWEAHGGQVCENAQVVRPVHSAEICRLGRLRPGDVSVQKGR